MTDKQNDLIDHLLKQLSEPTTPIPIQLQVFSLIVDYFRQYKIGLRNYKTILLDLIQSDIISLPIFDRALTELNFLVSKKSKSLSSHLEEITRTLYNLVEIITPSKLPHLLKSIINISCTTQQKTSFDRILRTRPRLCVSLLIKYIPQTIHSQLLKRSRSTESILDQFSPVWRTIFASSSSSSSHIKISADQKFTFFLELSKIGVLLKNHVLFEYLLHYSPLFSHSLQSSEDTLLTILRPMESLWDYFLILHPNPNHFNKNTFRIFKRILWILTSYIWEMNPNFDLSYFAPLVNKIFKFLHRMKRSFGGARSSSVKKNPFRGYYLEVTKLLVLFNILLIGGENIDVVLHCVNWVLELCVFDQNVMDLMLAEEKEKFLDFEVTCTANTLYYISTLNLYSTGRSKGLVGSMLSKLEPLLQKGSSGIKDQSDQKKMKGRTPRSASGSRTYRMLNEDLVEEDDELFDKNFLDQGVEEERENRSSRDGQGWADLDDSFFVNSEISMVLHSFRNVVKDPSLYLKRCGRVNSGFVRYELQKTKSSSSSFRRPSQEKPGRSSLRKKKNLWESQMFCRPLMVLLFGGLMVHPLYSSQTISLLKNLPKEKMNKGDDSFSLQLSMYLQPLMVRQIQLYPTQSLSYLYLLCGVGTSSFFVARAAQSALQSLPPSLASLKVRLYLEIWKSQTSSPQLDFFPLLKKETIDLFSQDLGSENLEKKREREICVGFVIHQVVSSDPHKGLEFLSLITDILKFEPKETDLQILFHSGSSYCLDSLDLLIENGYLHFHSVWDRISKFLIPKLRSFFQRFRANERRSSELTDQFVVRHVIRFLSKGEFHEPRKDLEEEGVEEYLETAFTKKYVDDFQEEVCSILDFLWDILLKENMWGMRKDVLGSLNSFSLHAHLYSFWKKNVRAGQMKMMSIYEYYVEQKKLFESVYVKRVMKMTERDDKDGKGMCEEMEEVMKEALTASLFLESRSSRFEKLKKKSEAKTKKGTKKKGTEEGEEEETEGEEEGTGQGGPLVMHSPPYLASLYFKHRNTSTLPLFLFNGTSQVISKKCSNLASQVQLLFKSTLRDLDKEGLEGDTSRIHDLYSIGMRTLTGQFLETLSSLKTQTAKRRAKKTTKRTTEEELTGFESLYSSILELRSEPSTDLSRKYALFSLLHRSPLTTFHYRQILRNYLQSQIDQDSDSMMSEPSRIWRTLIWTDCQLRLWEEDPSLLSPSFYQRNQNKNNKNPGKWDVLNSFLNSMFDLISTKKKYHYLSSLERFVVFFSPDQTDQMCVLLRSRCARFAVLCLLNYVQYLMGVGRKRLKRFYDSLYSQRSKEYDVRRSIRFTMKSLDMDRWNEGNYGESLLKIIYSSIDPKNKKNNDLLVELLELIVKRMRSMLLDEKTQEFDSVRMEEFLERDKYSLLVSFVKDLPLLFSKLNGPKKNLLELETSYFRWMEFLEFSYFSNLLKKSHLFRFSGEKVKEEKEDGWKRRKIGVLKKPFRFVKMYQHLGISLSFFCRQEQEEELGLEDLDRRKKFLLGQLSRVQDSEFFLESCDREQYYWVRLTASMIIACYFLSPFLFFGSSGRIQVIKKKKKKGKRRNDQFMVSLESFQFGLQHAIFYNEQEFDESILSPVYTILYSVLLRYFGQPKKLEDEEEEVEGEENNEKNMVGVEKVKFQQPLIEFVFEKFCGVGENGELVGRSEREEIMLVELLDPDCVPDLLPANFPKCFLLSILQKLLGKVKEGGLDEGGGRTVLSLTRAWLSSLPSHLLEKNTRRMTIGFDKEERGKQHQQSEERTVRTMILQLHELLLDLYRSSNTIKDPKIRSLILFEFIHDRKFIRSKTEYVEISRTVIDLIFDSKENSHLVTSFISRISDLLKTTTEEGSFMYRLDSLFRSIKEKLLSKRHLALMNPTEKKEFLSQVRTWSTTVSSLSVKENSSSSTSEKNQSLFQSLLTGRSSSDDGDNEVGSPPSSKKMQLSNVNVQKSEVFHTFVRMFNRQQIHKIQKSIVYLGLDWVAVLSEGFLQEVMNKLRFSRTLDVIQNNLDQFLSLQDDPKTRECQRVLLSYQLLYFHSVDLMAYFSEADISRMLFGKTKSQFSVAKDKPSSFFNFFMCRFFRQASFFGFEKEEGEEVIGKLLTRLVSQFSVRSGRRLEVLPMLVQLVRTSRSEEFRRRNIFVVAQSLEDFVLNCVGSGCKD